MAGAPRRRRPCLQRAAGLSCWMRPPGALLVLVLVVALLAGCHRPTTSPGVSPGAGTTATSTATAPAAQQLMTDVAAAVLAGRRGGYDRLLDSADPAFAARTAWLWTNLTTLPLTRLRFTVAAQQETASPAGAQTPGDTMPFTLTWRLRGQRRDASTTVRLVFADTENGLRWAGIADRDTTPTPVWWTTPVRVAVPPSGTADPAIVISARAAPAPRQGTWATIAQQAVRHAAAHAPPTRRETVPLIIEVPADADGFARATGRQATDGTGLAAITLGLGPDQRTAPAVIVLNPAAARAAGLRFVLTHEAVHALWRSPAYPAPMWLEEGFADTVAAAAYPAATRADDRRLWAQVRAHGAPRSFPADADFRPDASDLDATYALARSICTFIVDRWGWPALISIVTRVDADPHSRWWTVLDASSRAEVERQWSGWLASTAGR